MTAHLCDAVTLVVELDTQDGNGISLRDHLRQAGRTPPEATIWPAGQMWWNWFWELASSRMNNGFSDQPLSYSDIEAWSRLTGARPGLHGLRALVSMDAAFLRASAKVKKGA